MTLFDMHETRERWSALASFSARGGAVEGGGALAFDDHTFSGGGVDAQDVDLHGKLRLAVLEDDTTATACGSGGPAAVKAQLECAGEALGLGEGTKEGSVRVVVLIELDLDVEVVATAEGPDEGCVHVNTFDMEVVLVQRVFGRERE